MNTPLKHYWLIAGQVVTRKHTGVEYTKNLNTILPTTGPFTRKHLAHAQEGLQRRFLTECEQVKGARIVDVYIQAVSLLGAMTPEEFHAGFEEQKPVGTKELN